MSLDRERPNFAMVPIPLLLSGLSDRAVRLYAVLDHHAGDKRTAWPSRPTLGTEMGGCSPRSVDRAVEELEEHGYLTVERRRGARAVNRYTLLMRPRKPSTSSAVAARNSAKAVNSGSAKNSTRTRRSEQEPLASACSLCEGQGWLLGDDGLAHVCNHKLEETA